MSRYFAPISVEDFKSKLFAALKKHDDFEDIRDYNKTDAKNEYNDWKSLTELDTGFYQIERILPNLTEQIRKDLKVRFDLENTGSEGGRVNEPPYGVNTLDNGMTFYGMYAGGDWELPVYFIIYWDGKALRGYVPTDGNPYNTDTNEAYGNDEDADQVNIHKRYPDLPFEKGYGNSAHYSSDDLQFEGDKIIADIKARITLKGQSKKLSKAEPKKSQTSHIFSGDASRGLWKDINALSESFPTVQTALYHLGCKCRELEALVRKQAEQLEKLQK